MGRLSTCAPRRALRVGAALLCAAILPAALFGCGAPEAPEETADAEAAADSGAIEEASDAAPADGTDTATVTGTDAAAAAVDNSDGTDPYAFGDEEPIPQANLITADEFEAAANAGDALIIDVRSPATYSILMFPWELLNIPVNQLALRDREYLDEPALIIAAADNEEAARAFGALVEAGYPAESIKVLDGGMKGWLLEFRDAEVHPPPRGC